ncbi:MAG: SdrD B-like domain-containing protein [Pseudomonadota bacterium]
MNGVGGTISGRVYLDNDRNGFYNADTDDRLAGLTVSLYRAGTFVDFQTSVTTDDRGFFRFDNLGGTFGASYQILVTGPENLTAVQSPLGTNSALLSAYIGPDFTFQSLDVGFADHTGFTRLDGTPGNDSASLGGVDLIGTSGKDLIYGFAGDDHIYGGDQDDRIFGGDGNDVISGSWGSNEIDGGDGLDTVIIDGERRDFVISSPDGNILEIGGAGVFNRIWDVEWLTFVQDGQVVDDFNIAEFLNNWSPTAPTAPVVIRGTDGNDSASFGNQSLIGTDNRSIVDEIIGFGGDDLIYGLAGTDRIFGGDGNDIMSGGQGTNYLDGGAGLDTLILDGARNQFTWTVQDDLQTVQFQGNGQNTFVKNATWATFVVDGEVIDSVNLAGILQPAIIAARRSGTLPEDWAGEPPPEAPDGLVLVDETVYLSRVAVDDGLVA